jgi:hypothetical protein
MSAHRIEAQLNEDGRLVLENLPFEAGDLVEVTIVENKTTSNGNYAELIMQTSTARSDDLNPYPLRGKVIKYDSPTDPVGVEDWDGLK